MRSSFSQTISNLSSCIFPHLYDSHVCNGRIGRRLPFELADDLAKLDHLKRTFRPIVFPAYDDITTAQIVAMIAEVAATILELDANALPAVFASIDATFSQAVRERSLHRFHGEAQFAAYHAEQEDNALFVDGRMTKAAKVYRGAELLAGEQPTCGCLRVG